MAVAPIVKYDAFIDELSKAGHNLATAVFKAALTNTAPGAADTVWNTTVAPPMSAWTEMPSAGAFTTSFTGRLPSARATQCACAR